MKRIICIMLSLIITLSLFGCRNANNNSVFKTPEPLAKINSDLRVERTNDNFNRTVYLTENKFFFVSDMNNVQFGDGLQAFVYDLKEQTVKPMFDFSSSGIEYIAMATDKKLYIETYTYTNNTKSAWGFCLIEYDIESGNTKKIYETPNTVYSIDSVIIGDTLMYSANTSDQDGLEEDITSYEIHTFKNGKDEVILDGLYAEYLEFCTRDGKQYLVLETYDDNSQQTVYEIVNDCTLKKTSKTIDLEDEKYNTFISESVGEYSVDGKYGDYYILNDGENDKFGEFDNGYQYYSSYYLYNTKTKETTKLTTALFTEYYT